MLPQLCIAIAMINTFLLITYASVFKRSGFLGNIVVSYMVSSIFIFGAGITNELIIGAFLAITAFFAETAREVLKDLEDVRGDKIGGAKTLPTERGRKKTSVIVVAFLLLGICFSPIPYLSHIFSAYYLFVVLIADLVFVKVIVSVLNSKTNTSRNMNLLNKGINIALIAFFAGLIPI